MAQPHSFTQPTHLFLHLQYAPRVCVTDGPWRCVCVYWGCDGLEEHTSIQDFFIHPLPEEEDE